MGCGIKAVMTDCESLVWQHNTRRLRGDLVETYKILHGKEDIDGCQMFKYLVDQDLWVHDFSVYKQHGRLNIRKHFSLHGNTTERLHSYYKKWFTGVSRSGWPALYGQSTACTPTVYWISRWQTSSAKMTEPQDNSTTLSSADAAAVVAEVGATATGWCQIEFIDQHHN